MKILNLSYIIIAIFFFLTSCKHDPSDGHSHGSEKEESPHVHDSQNNHNEGDEKMQEEHIEGEVHLTNEQVKTVDITFGKLSSIKLMILFLPQEP